MAFPFFFEEQLYAHEKAQRLQSFSIRWHQEERPPRTQSDSVNEL